MSRSKKNIYKDLLLGVAIGDALGVPVEFMSREQLGKNPVEDMIGDGTHGQLAGTWSDDSSLTFCLAEALLEDGALEAIAQNFVLWYTENYWSARGEVFDIGKTTKEAILRLKNGVPPTESGLTKETDNGNGSLMRVAPLVFFLRDKPIHKRFEIVRQVSSITHAHIRSVIACFYYLEFALQILEGKDLQKIYTELQNSIPNFLYSIFIDEKEVNIFYRLLNSNIAEVSIDNIKSSGYVVDTLEASIWCLFNADSYKNAVLKAVNLGRDTDTIAAVTGGLAALHFGLRGIPVKWKYELARIDDIEELGERMQQKFHSLERSK